MIRYEKRRWSSHLFDIRGSMLLEIVGRVSACVLWSLIVVTAHHFYRGLAVPATAHTLIGAALGLLLVFRTNASYDRYWEGRRQWGAIINESRNLGRMSRVYLNQAHPTWRGASGCGRWPSPTPWPTACVTATAWDPPAIYCRPWKPTPRWRLGTLRWPPPPG